MKCRDCIHWAPPRSVESLPDYPIGFCEIFQKDVAGELAGCAGKFFLSKNREDWRGTIHEKEAPADLPIEIPDGAKIVSISEPIAPDGRVKIVYLMPEK
ncbi:MAG: hypothetical protein GYA21_16900 [Myxococcales bacterium]|nr:hypothetical protein [Myxococcales bacterium]